MSGIVLGSGTAGSSEAVVDTNGHLHVRTPTTEADAGFASMSSEVDPGTITGSRYVRAPECSDDYRLRVGVDSVIFNHSFEGTAVAQDRFSQTTSTHAIAQASGFLTLNSGASTAVGSAVVKSYRNFPLFGTYQTYVEIWVKPVNETATNSIKEFGVGYAAASSAATDGVFFRYNAAGALFGVASYGGSENTVALTSPTTNTVHHFLIAIHNEEAEFWINDVLYGRLTTPVAQPAPMQSQQQPFFARVYCTGVASAAPQLSIGFINVTQGDLDAAKPWGHQMVGMGGGAYQIQPGTASGPTVTRGAASTTGWPTSGTAQTAPTYTATSAPATNSLGGLFVTPAISTMAADADYPVYSYLNPLGTKDLPGKTLYITGCRIGELIAKAAASTNTSITVFAVGIGSTSSATTATEGAAVVAARLIPVGQCFWPSTAAIGDTKGGWTLDFSAAPLVCPPGTYVQLIMRQVGTVTSNTLTLQGTAAFMGYHE